MSDLENELKQQADEGNWEQVENIWLELSDQTPDDVTLYREVLESMTGLDQKRRIQDMASIMVESWRGQDLDEHAFELMEPLVKNDLLPSGLTDDFRGVLETVYEDHPALDVSLRLSGIKSGSVDSQAYADFRSFITFKPERYVHHGSGWGTGKIVEVRSTLESVVIDFENKRGHEMDLEAAQEYLSVIDENDPRALGYEGSDVLEEALDEQPATIIRSYLETRDTDVPLKELRDLLKEHVFSSSQWTNWWNRTKTKLLEHPNIEMSGQSAPDLSYRDVSVNPQEELISKIRYAEHPDEVQKAIQNFSSLVERKDEMQEKMKDVLREKASYFLSKAEEGKHRVAFTSLLLFLDRKTSYLPDGLLEDVLPKILTLEEDREERIEDVSNLLNSLRHGDELKTVLSMMEKAFGDELPHLEQELLTRVHGAAWKHIARHLLEQSDEKYLQEALFELTGVPGTYPLPYLSLVRFRDQSFLEPVEEFLPTSTELFRSLIELAELDTDRYLPSDWTVRQFTKQVEDAILRNFDDIVEEATTTLSTAQSMKLRNKVKRMHGFKDTTRAKMLNNLEEAKEEQDVGRFWESDLIFCTQEGIEQRQATYDEIVSEKMPENQRAIEEARAQGDVSENAELDAALEERSLLTSRARKLKKELEHARNLADAPVQDSEVQPGTCVKLRKTATDETLSYTILGPWDSNADENIISYESPLAEGLLEAKEDEERTVSLPDGEVTYRVEQIEKAI